MDPLQVQSEMMKHHQGSSFGFAKLQFGVRRSPLLKGIASVADNTLIELQGSLSNQGEKLAAYAQQLREECSANEEKQLLEKVAELLASSRWSLRRLGYRPFLVLHRMLSCKPATDVQTTVDDLRESSACRTSKLQQEVSSMQDFTHTVKDEWNIYMEKTDSEDTATVESGKRALEEALQHCQERVFAEQVFELHRLIKVQRYLAGSPHLLLENNPRVKEPAMKVPPKKLPKSPTPIAKQRSGSQKPIQSHDQNEPDASSTKVSPWIFNPPPGNQWLVSVMSAMEGLVYKPYRGSFPPNEGFMAPSYGAPVLNQVQSEMMKHHQGSSFGFAKLQFGVRLSP
ncbi:hypothetical protein GIB67_018774, partial [Kingdonia uniflora]